MKHEYPNHIITQYTVLWTENMWSSYEPEADLELL